MSASHAERRAFLTRLRSDPIFFCRHVPTLSRAVSRKLRNRLTILLAPEHRGRKRRLEWLEPVSERERKRVRDTSIVRLPSYPRLLQSKTESFAARRSSQSFADPEDAFAAHRWAFLLDALLDGTVDWHNELAECRHWIGGNSVKKGPAWEPYSASERVANLLVFLSMMPPQMREREFSPELLVFVGESLDWICDHIEYYGPAETNNHIIANARALVMGGVVADDREALKAGLEIFRVWLPRLVMAEGFLRERSSHYQLIVTNWVLDAWRFLAAHGRADDAETALLDAFASRMLDAATLLCDGTSLLPLVGDVSPDATPEQSLARLTLLYPDRWLPAARAFRPVETRDGWFRLRCGGDVVVGNFPAGRYPLGFPTHGHADLTGFVWINGRDVVLADLGRCRYTADPVSLFQKSALGHNLPLVNGLAPFAESFIDNGSWWPLPYATADLEMTVRGDGLELAHDGFARATPVTRHARRLLLEDGVLTVIDAFEGHVEVDVAFCWHFGASFETFDAESLVAAGKRGRVRLHFDGVVGPPRVAPASGVAPGSWISSTYGDKRPAVGVSLNWRVPLPAAVTTRFVLVNT